MWHGLRLLYINQFSKPSPINREEDLYIAGLVSVLVMIIAVQLPAEIYVVNHLHCGFIFHQSLYFSVELIGDAASEKRYCI